MFWFICHRTCKLEVFQRLLDHRCRVHHMHSRICSPRRSRPAPKRRKVCVSISHSRVFHSGFCRYANVDYVVVRSTRHNLGPKKIASYDIMCQWSINLRERLQTFPLDNAKHLDDKIVARMVPKFHLAAHRQQCRASFSLNYEPGAGRRDMEGPERTWFGLQGGGSTKDQGPGFWSDAMDDKFGHWNWSKLVGLGTCSCLLSVG